MELILIISLVASLIANGILIYRGITLIRELETLESQYNNLIESYEETTTEMLEQMKSLDLNGSFEADDEVGAVFTQLKDLIESYKELR